MQAGKLRAARAQRIIRLAAPIGLGIICIVALSDRLEGLDAASVRGAVGAITPLQWLAALAATSLSFWSLGRYDAVVHRHLRTGVRTSAALRSGAAAIALSQVLGMGVVTGALARWRMLPGLSPLDAARVSALVAVSFMGAWAVVTALVTLAFPVAALPWFTSPAVLAMALGLALTAFFVPTLPFFGRRIDLPSLPALTAILGFTALDTAAAALAFYMLLPAGLAPDPGTVFAAYLLALGAALATGTPGGVGPFELALVALLPSVPDAELLASIVAFRAVYYALPACLALVPMARPFRRGMAARSRPRLSPEAPRDIALATRAELGVARQNGARGLEARGARAAVIGTAQALSLLFAPTRGRLSALLPALHAEAERTNRTPCLYKISARDAALARRAGWRVARIADEAVIAPAAFDLSGSTHRQLRRKLRHAEKAGVTVRHGLTLPLGHLSRIDRIWSKAHGGARGLTVGLFDPAYVETQRVYLAEQDGAPIAFVTFHEGPAEWTLDLMRHLPDLPDGTMQSLIATALADARAAGVPRLSLAAMPARPACEGRLTARLRAEIAQRSGGAGLIRFKSAFAPRCEPLYAAAPTRAGLALALADLARAIRATSTEPRPSPLARPKALAARAIAFRRRT
ncbi:phosphatidylglycerol lysyltransferase domain-containing protein [Oceanicola sp. 22II-s10i]|uniref:phosphatidylglycerol lysyltransferase domain-containing protein n=1 Tax=Oceanicola sp. 22II-s10i TaxID=1317116 RepID=UPI0011302066|nr:phosphatidylglycerol lysyltransferase domain-containing protein [Oceanicola sp. 22II-s10i]